MTSKVAVFGAKSYDRQFLNEANKKLSGGKVQLIFYEERLNSGNTVLVDGCEVIICFVNDKVGAETVELLSQKGVKHISMRCAGYDNVDLAACKKAGITVSRVPAYSPYSVAEHALALMLALNRKIPKAFNKVREGDFSLKGLLGFDMHGKTCGVVGTGRIGFNLCKILLAMGCKVVAFDIYQSEEAKKAGVTYVTLDELLAQSDIISLHANLSESTRHMINDASIAKMKDGVMIINTSRGALLDTKAVIEGLKSKKIGYLGIDVYEFEQQYFFEDKSEEIVQDDILMRLTSFSNVIITAHQAYFTKEALENIATETISNVVSFVTTGTVKKENTVQ